MRENMTWQCRIAPSLGNGFAGTPNEVWGTTDYISDTKPTVFFGLYGLPDFYALWRHKGPKAILWCGSDIRHFTDGYWLDDGEIKLDPKPLAEWISLNCDIYVENNLEAIELAKLSIQSSVIPSFLGNVNDYQPQEIKPNQYYSSVSGDDFELYGWDNIWKFASKHKDIEFHLYGNKTEWKTYFPNVFVHGRVPQEQMDEETKTMTGALRLTKFDGFSEILAKSILWGQKPVSPYVTYPHIAKDLNDKTEYNAREYYIKQINNYPWNVKIN